MEPFTNCEPALVQCTLARRLKVRALRDIEQTLRRALFQMQKGKPRYAGPMSMQPVDHSSTMPAPLLPAMPGSNDADGTITPVPGRKLTRNDAVRVAKARIHAAQLAPKAAAGAKGITPDRPQFRELFSPSSFCRYDSPCTVNRCSFFSPSMYNFIRCLERRSRAPFVSERSARRRICSTRGRREECTWAMIHSDFDLDSKARCSLSFRYLADAIIGVGRKYWRVSTGRAYSTHLRSATAGRQRDACFASTKLTSTPLLTDFANRSTSQFVNRTQPFDSDLLTRDGSAVP